MTQSPWKLALTGLFALAALCVFSNCEKHSWDEDTSKLFEPHHGHGDGHDQKDAEGEKKDH